MLYFIFSKLVSSIWRISLTYQEKELYLICIITWYVANLQLFAANQNKPADIISILVANRSKLLRLFADFKTDKGVYAIHFSSICMRWWKFTKLFIFCPFC